MAVQTAKNADADLTKQVPLAFSAGWNIAELYFARIPAKVKFLNPADLPIRLAELSTIPAWQRVKLTWRRVDSQLAELGLKPSATVDFETLKLNDDAATTFKRQINSIHMETLGGLAASSAQVLLGYRLGVALAMTVLTVRGSNGIPYAEELKGPRVETMREWLASLRTVFPDHSADAVKYTLAEWRDWAANRKTTTANDGRSTSSLRKQGEAWRALLSGEQPAKDMLEARDYLRAASRMVRRLGRLLTTSALSGLGLVALLVVVLLVAAGAWILSTGYTLTKLVTIGLALGAPVGITALSVYATLQRSLSKAQEPIWNALVVEAIGEASYINPTGHTPVHTSQLRLLWTRLFPGPSVPASDDDEEAAPVSKPGVSDDQGPEKP